MGVKQIVLHIGIPKTGTTSMQNTIYDPANRKLIEDKGYKFIETWGYETQALLYSLFSDHSTFYLSNFLQRSLSDQEAAKVRSDYLGYLLKEARDTKADKLLLSSESIGLLPRNCVEKIKNFFLSNLGEVDFRVNAYVRNPVTHTASSIQEELASPGTPQFQFTNWFPGLISWREKRLQSTIGSYLEVFGRESFKAYEFEQAIRYPIAGLVGHFLSILGFSQEEIEKFSIWKSNESRSAETIELLDYMHLKFPPYVYVDGNPVANPLKLPYSADTNALWDVRGVKFDLSYEQKKEIQQASAEDMLWLKEHTGIDYTNYEVSKSKCAEYGKDTVTDFQFAFGRLSYNTKPYFMEFFEKKYNETNDFKFEPLFAKGSAVYTNQQISLAIAEYMRLLLPEAECNGKMRQVVWPEAVRIYFDNGNGFTAKNRIVCVFDRNYYVEADATFCPDEHVRKISISTNFHPAILLIKNIMVNGKSGQLKLEGGKYLFEHNGLYAFMVPNSEAIFTTDEPITSLQAEFYADICSSFFAFCIGQLQQHTPEVKQYTEHMQQQAKHLNAKLQKLPSIGKFFKRKIYKALGIKSGRDLNPFKKGKR